MSIVVPSLIVVAIGYRQEGPLGEQFWGPHGDAWRRNIVLGNVGAIISATAAVLAARVGAVMARAATTSKGLSAKISLSLCAILLFLAAFPAAFLAFLCWYGANSW